MSPSDFIHPEDAAALQQMESIPGFSTLVKKVLAAIAKLDHPFSAVRVREILKWGDTEQYWMIKNGGAMSASSAHTCPRCGGIVDESWRFCRNCGAPLNS